MRLSAPAKTQLIFVAFNIIVALSMLACSGTPPRAPVADVAPPPSIRIQEHVVARGETLYSIAWRYGMNHRELAAANGIGSSYRIYPGQRLNLDLSRRAQTTTAPAAPVNPPATAARTTPPTPASKPPRLKNQTPAATAAPVPSLGPDPKTWHWPVKGPLLASFQSNGGLNKGIDIGGKLGEPVVAAASGEVVYSGSGLRGYGKLIIVKHSEKYLSAYAHNSKLLVDEGDVVKAGQPIAELGSSGTDRVKLHFEIRYDGKPVNPQKYLPPR